MTDQRDPQLHPGRFRALFLLALVTLITWIFFEMIQPFVVALLLGAIFSGMAYPLFVWIVKRLGGRRSLASFLTLVLFTVGLLVPLGVFMGVVANQALHVSESVSPWIQEQLGRDDVFDTWLSGLPFSEVIAPYRDQIDRRAAELASSLGGFVVARVADVGRGTVQFIFLLFIMLYAMFFFLKDGRQLLRKILYYMPLAPADEHRMLEKFVSVTRAMVKGTLLIGIAQGALAGGAFAVLGIPASVFWGTVMAVLSIVPGVGTALVWVPAVIYLLAIDRTGAALALFVWCAVVVGLVDNLLRPWLVGRDTKMPDLLILLGTLGGLVLFGAAGLLIGPIVAALFVTVWELYGEAFAELLPRGELPDLTDPGEYPPSTVRPD